MPLNLRSVLPPNVTAASALNTVTGIRDGSVRRQASRVLVNRHHQRVGGLTRPVGLPMGDLQPLGDRGLVKPYSGGTIELLDFDDGPQGFQRFSSRNAMSWAIASSTRRRTATETNRISSSASRDSDLERNVVSDRPSQTDIM